MWRGGFHTGNGNISIPPHLDLPSFQLPAFTLFRAQLGHPVGAPVRRKMQMSCFARPSFCRRVVSAQARRWMSTCRVLADGSIRLVPCVFYSKSSMILLKCDAVHTAGTDPGSGVPGTQRTRYPGYYIAVIALH